MLEEDVGLKMHGHGMNNNAPKCWWCNVPLGRKPKLPGEPMGFYFAVVRDLDGNAIRVHKRCKHEAAKSFLPQEGITATEVKDVDGTGIEN